MARPAQRRAALDSAALDRKRWFKRFDLGVAGFMMSLGLTMAGLYDDARGSDIAVRPLDQLLVYRDGDVASGVNHAVFKLVMVNAASASHGDMVMDAALEVGGLSFAMGATVQPTFTSDPRVAEKCPLDSRCILADGLVAIEQPDKVLDIAGGSHQLASLTFPLVGWNCTGNRARCDALTAQTSASLLAADAKPKLHLRFFADGKRVLDCSAKIDTAYLAKFGWNAATCKNATVSGGPLL